MKTEKILRGYMDSLLCKQMRDDGRALYDYRAVVVEDNPIKNACGSARVKIGKTEVLVGVKLDVASQFPDTPDEGVLMVNAELFPISNPDFEPGPPGENAIELARVTDRAIRESEAIDFKGLCITPKEKVWMVYVDILPVNDDGNLFDASVLAATRALKLARLPKYNAKEGRVEFMQPTNEKIKMRQLPVMCTFGKISGVIFADPTLREESVFGARLSIATLENGSVCAMQKGDEGTFTQEEVLKMIDSAADRGKELRKLLKE